MHICQFSLIKNHWIFTATNGFQRMASLYLEIQKNIYFDKTSILFVLSLLKIEAHNSIQKIVFHSIIVVK